MPNCRNCGARLSKFDTDLCPVCGIKNPLQGTSSETVEITSQIDLSEMKEGQKVLRRRKKFIEPCRYRWFIRCILFRR